MPPRQVVEIKYAKAAGSREMRKIHPNAGKSHASRMKKPEPLSPLTEYVHNNQDPETGLPSTRDLMYEFQEDECKHTFKVLAQAGNYSSLIRIECCTDCGRVKILGKG